MKKIVVLSDTHGNLGAIYSIYDILLESDMVFHLGDHFDDMNELSQTLGDKLYRVYGNCDFGRDPKEILVEVEGLKIFATHGDLYGVKRSADKLVERAKTLDANVVFYGHTHSAEIREVDGITIINPGSAERYGTNKSFCYCVVSGEKITAVINKNID